MLVQPTLRIMESSCFGRALVDFERPFRPLAKHLLPACQTERALPDWFEAVNRDCRYQLTVIGSFAQAIVGEKIKGNRFSIKSNAPEVEVSWLITGIRSDAATLKRPFKLEEDKQQNERGFYLTPSAYDKHEERGVEWARNQRMMKQLKQQRLEVEQRK